MSDAVVVRIENASTAVPRRYKVNFALAAIMLVALQLAMPAWTLEYKEQNQEGHWQYFSRPLTEHIFGRALLFVPPRLDARSIPKEARSSDLQNLTTQVDWNSTLCTIVLSLLYLGAGAYGVVGGNPGRALRHKRLMQFLLVSTIFIGGSSAMLIITTWRHPAALQNNWTLKR